nr:SMC-Scp complex subunit ScpB [Actinomycetota bacterium]NIS36283.1 SMC-Scp complex subunit ScpB [Actinomycetota bacterium]NIT98638.1 SMC-Scp complex subunit ScpB [Actinomycetota bacterium]NIU22254.1 SMC-Scp complex subunit ScpB [Actinomycetota bacterium]NIU70833.1 SMC-Scp complex subunit ScpB [Actinomycetota bacterium]
SARLSAAALETLAVVAYKQPVSRNQIAAIRGVNVDGVMRTLQQRGYVDEVARDPGPGQAVLYGTTPTFLERLGLDSVNDLPPLGDFFPQPEVVEALERGLRVVTDEEISREELAPTGPDDEPPE